MKNPIRSLKTFNVAIQLFIIAALQASAAEAIRIHEDRTSGPFVSLDTEGKLVYQPFTDRGDVIMDYSFAGYRASEAPIPDVPSVIDYTDRLDPLVGELIPDGSMAYPKGPDSRERIQAALDAVAAMEPMANGYRGAVVLNRGTYYLDGGLTLASGVVLRGRGDDPDGTVLIIRNPTGVGITLGHASSPVAIEGSTSRITDAYVASGSREVTVEDASLYQVGDHVHVTKTVNQTWIETLGMTFPEGPRPGEPVW
jgi:hypothetical protein